MRDTKVDMLHGPLAGKLFWFALPIAASSMLQQLFNAADTAVVGKFADAAALAAVGTNGEIVAFIVSLSAGLAVGTNVLLGMCIGKGEKKDIQGVIQIAMVLALAVGLVGLLLGQVVARPILVLIHTPEEILDLAVQYLRIYCLGYPALLVYDFGSAILRSKGGQPQAISDPDVFRLYQCGPESVFRHCVWTGCGRCCHCYRSFHPVFCGDGCLVADPGDG